MTTLKIEAKFTYDEIAMHSGDSDKEAREWFLNDILKNDVLLVYSQEVGDYIGVLGIIDSSSNSG